MGSHTRFGMFGKKEINRFCQLESHFEFTFKKDLPSKLPVYFTVDGENYMLIDPDKLVFR